MFSSSLARSLSLWRAYSIACVLLAKRLEATSLSIQARSSSSRAMLVFIFLPIVYPILLYCTAKYLSRYALFYPIGV